MLGIIIKILMYISPNYKLLINKFWPYITGVSKNVTNLWTRIKIRKNGKDS